MPLFTYVGPFDAVECLGQTAVKGGDPIEGPADLAEQVDNWKPVKAPKNAKES